MKLLVRLWLKMLKEWWQLTVPMRLRAQGVELGIGVRFYGMPVVGMAKGSRICIGDRVVLCSDSRFTALGVNHPVMLRTLSPGAKIISGNDWVSVVARSVQRRVSNWVMNVCSVPM